MFDSASDIFSFEGDDLSFIKNMDDNSAFSSSAVSSSGVSSSASEFSGLSVQNLSFAYPGRETVFEALGFEVAPGRILGLAGANGSGKSTLLDLLAGILTPTGGGIRLAGQEGTKSLRSLSALLPQNVDHWLLGETPREDLELAFGFYGSDKSVQGDRLTAGAEYWGLGEILDDPVDALSIGQKKRLALASALAGEPTLVLLDEPFAGLDWPACQALLKDLTRLPQSGAVVVIATHEPELVKKHVDDWLLLKPGAHLFGPPARTLSRLAEFGARPVQSSPHNAADDSGWDEPVETDRLNWDD